MGDGDQRRRRHGCDRRHSGNDLERDPGLGERECLLGPATEHERVASFQPHDVQAGRTVGDEEPGHCLLRHSPPRDHERIGGGFLDELVCDEDIDDEDVARADQLEAASGDQPWISWPGTDEMDRHPSSCATSPAK